MIDVFYKKIISKIFFDQPPVKNHMKDKLTIVIDRYWPFLGGVEQAATSLAAHLSKQFEIKIVTHYLSESKSLYFSYTRRPQHKAFKDPSGNPITILKSKRKTLLLPLILWQFPFLRKRKAPELFDRLYKFYRTTFRGDLERLLKDSAIVHCFSTGYLARLTAEICKDQNIALVHSPYIHFGKWGDSPEQIRAYKSADALICPTSSFRQRFVSLYGCCPTCRIIPPVVPEPVKPSNSLSPVPGRYILFLGRREPHKGIDMLIEAFKKFEDHNISLVVAGPGSPLKIPNSRIHDLGRITDDLKARLLTDCDLLCVPSTDETFGIVYTEAMSYGKPVIALDIPPVNEIVENEKTGILVKANDPRGLHSALSRLVSDDNLRRSMGNSAFRRFIDHYSGEKTSGEISHLYNEITARRR